MLVHNPTQPSDTRPIGCKLHDLDNKLATVLYLAPRRQSETLRRVIWQGRTFVEGDGSGFYGENEFGEITAEVARLFIEEATHIYSGGRS